MQKLSKPFKQSCAWPDHLQHPLHFIGAKTDLMIYSFGLFAMDHAAWLYNYIPQSMSGITPIKMVTSMKSDHCDLMWAHVWGCHVYVLEPKLQDNQKLPKWNGCACMGQFLGFSCEHLSLVAMIRNLYSGFVSPQYHVVFYNNFQTVFTDGETS